MPFRFSHLCDLLCALEKIETREPPLLKVDHQKAIRATIESWFKTHRRAIDAPDTNGVAFLSFLFPERRTDRVYGMQTARLSKTVARCLSLNRDRSEDLQAWKMPGKGDLGACVERVQKIFDTVPCQAVVSIDEVDTALQELASRCPFSSPEIRSDPSTRDPVDILKPIFQKLRSWEAKWLTRAILKDFGSLNIDETLILSNYHFLLPSVLRFQSTFHAAIALLSGPLKRYHSNPDHLSQRIFCEEAAKLIRPRTGIKAGRPEFHKARSIEHCLKMVAKRRYSVERKYDGEYCEIHVDLEQSQSIQIFSKSGKDSTQDRQGIHEAVRDCLRIGQPYCKFKKRCIVVGELLVFCDKEEKILEFHKIRKHVLRSGRFIGTDEDSQAHPHEHLMLVLYDILLVDDRVVMVEPYEQRRQCLRDLIVKKRGRVMTSEWRIIDFSMEDAASSLMYQFAASQAARCEGLVLKPADVPYFSLVEGDPGCSNDGFIKLKKDYMQALGEERDIADFAVVGASYDPQQAQRSGLRKIRWTTFYLGCLENSNAIRFGTKPCFRVLATISLHKCVPEHDSNTLNELGQFRSELYGELKDLDGEFLLNLSPALHKQMQVVFREPFVVEVLGSGFEKPANQSVFMLRHPRILKVHLDRTWKDAVTLGELQKMADEARGAPTEGESQETARLLEHLERRLIRKVERDGPRALSSSRTVASSTPKASPRRSSGQQRRGCAPSPLVRMDAVEMLPGGEQFVSPTHSNKVRRSPIADATDSLPTPPTSSGTVPDEHVPMLSNLDLPKQTLSAQRKRTADQAVDQTRGHGGYATVPSKRTKACHSQSLPQTVPASRLKRKTSIAFQQTLRPTVPLADITNRSPQSSPRRRSCTSRVEEQQTRATSAQTSPVTMERKHSEDEPQAMSCVSAGSNSFRTAPATIPPPISGVCTIRNPSSEDCFATNMVVYLSPCIAGQHSVSKDLVKGHGATQVSSLSHWDRKILDVPPLSDIVGESQAYPGMTKVVLLETSTGREQECMGVVQEIEKLKLKDTILLYDWRLLEDLAFFERMDEGERAAMSEDMRQRKAALKATRLFGMTRWNIEEKRVYFIRGARGAELHSK